MKCIYKDKAGNKLFVDKETYYAKNAKNELITKHGLFTMMREKGISTKNVKEKYVGKKRDKKTK